MRKEALLSAALDTLEDLVYVFDAAGRPVHWNARTRTVTGYDDAVLAELHLFDLFAPSARSLLEDAVEWLRSGDLVTVEVPLRTHGGEEIPYEFKASPLYDPDGGYAGFTGTGRDIRARQRREARLRRCNEALERLARLQLRDLDAFRDTLHDIGTTVVDTLQGARASVWRFEDGGARARCLACSAEDGVPFGAGTLLTTDEHGAFLDTLRSERVAVVDAAQADPALAALRSAMATTGVVRLMSAPVRRDGCTEGAVTVGTRDAGRRWNTDEEQFLRSVADVVSLVFEAEQRLRTEHALDASRARFQDVVDSVREVLFQVDAEGRWTVLNAAWTRILGYSVEDSLGRSCLEVVHPDDAARTRAALAKLRRGEAETCREELRLVRRDETVCWVEVHGQRYVDDNGRPAGARGTIADITDRRRAEEGRASAEQLFRRLVEQSLVGIYIVQDGVFRYVNPQLAEMLGHEQGAMIGRSPLDYIVREDHPLVSENLRRRLEGEVDDVRYSFRGLRADGSTLTVEVHGLRTDFDGRPAVLGVLLDVTERLDYEQHLIDARDRAEEMNRIKSAFLANMSHEIRTPLTAILGFTDILGSEVSDEGREFVRYIRNSGRRLLETLNTILDLAQLEGGVLRLQNEPLELAAFVSEITFSYQKAVRDQGLALVVEVPERPTWALCDAVAMKRVLDSLVSNAVKFTPEGHVAVRLRVEGGAACIDVEDTGIGIHDGFLPHVFDEFKQESTGTARDYEGSGLGLAVARRLVEHMNGKITVRSRKGEGSCFTLSMPCVRDPEASSRHDGPVGHVLVVEDDPNTRRLLQVGLGAAFQVTVVSNVEEALRVAASAVFDGLVLDINLHEARTGADLLQALRERPGYDAVPAVALTGYTRAVDFEHFYAAGFDACLGKPFDVDRLLQLLRTLIAPPAAP